MKTSLRHLAMLAATLAFGLGTAQSQNANFTNSLGGDWNTAANWDLDGLGINVVPAEGTNALVGSFGAMTVDYNAPMAATSFGSLNVSGGATLNINASGFNQNLGGVATAPLTVGGGTVNVGVSGVWSATNGGPITLNSGGALNVGGNMTVIPVSTATAGLAVTAGGGLTVNSGGAMTIQDAGATTFAVGSLVTNNGTMLFTNSGSITLPNGTTPVNILTLNAGSTLTMTNTPGSAGLNVGSGNSSSQGAIMTIDGGTLNLDKLLTLAGTGSRVFVNSGTLNCFGNSRVNDTSNDGAQRVEVRNGTANLGNFSVYRTTSAGGLIVSNGVVNATGIQIGTGNSGSYATIYGGTVTNTGIFTVCDRNNAATTGERRPRFLLRGGTVVSTGTAGIVVANQANAAVGGAASSISGILDVNLGTLIAEGITLVKDNTLTNAHAVLNLSGPGVINLGSVGLNGNVGPINSSYAFNMSGGTLAAHANYAINANIVLTGTGATFQAADAGGSPFNITANGIISSSGILTKTGGGTLTLNAANTYNNFTFISAGTLALGASGTIANTPKITVAAGATFDVSAAGYTLASGRTLAGGGSVIGSFTAQSGSTLSPGTSAGTLTFNSGLTQQGGVINAFELSDDPTGTIKTNDLISVVGDLNVSAGVNTILVSALDASIPTAVYKIMEYTGNLIGSEANFAVSGVSGTVSNNATLKAVFLSTSSVRGPTSVVWLGGLGGNIWDALVTSNWLNGVSRDFFVTGDAARFDDTGATNPIVNLSDILLPGSVTVDTASNYTFTGPGRISGGTGLSKTNSGTLTVQTTNDYTGITVLGGGVLEASLLANGGVASGIGAAAGNAANLVFDGGTLRYTGPSVSISRAATLNPGGGGIDVSTAATALTISGSSVGAGALIKSGVGQVTLTAASTYAGGTILSNGVLQLNATAAAGTGGITNYGATLRVSGATAEDNQLDFRGNCTLEFTGVGSGNIPLRGAWSGDGTVKVNFLTQNTSQTFSLGGEGAGGGHMWDFSGTVDFGTNRGFCRLNNNSTFNYGSSNATFNLGQGDMNFSQRNGGTTTHLGALVGGPSTRLSGSRSDVHGLEIYSIGGNNLSTTFEGTITNGGQASDIAAITKVGTGKLTLTGLSPYTGATTVEAGTLQVDGQITASAISVNGGTLSGNGSIGNSVTIQYGAYLSPGASVGRLTVGTLTLNSGSTNIMEIDRANGTNDSVRATSTVTFGGALVVNNLGGTLADGDVFKLFDAAGGYFGVFDTIELPALSGPYLFWDTTQLAVDGTIRVYTPKPTITGFGLDGSNLYLTGNDGGNTSTHYIVLTSTNVAAPANLWTPVVTNTFEFDGSFGFTNAVNPTTPAQFFRVKTP